MSLLCRNLSQSQRVQSKQKRKRSNHAQREEAAASSKDDNRSLRRSSTDGMERDGEEEDRRYAVLFVCVGVCMVGCLCTCVRVRRQRLIIVLGVQEGGRGQGCGVYNQQGEQQGREKMKTRAGRGTRGQQGCSRTRRCSDGAPNGLGHAAPHKQKQSRLGRYAGYARTRAKTPNSRLAGGSRTG